MARSKTESKKLSADAHLDRWLRLSPDPDKRRRSSSRLRGNEPHDETTTEPQRINKLVLNEKNEFVLRAFDDLVVASVKLRSAADGEKVQARRGTMQRVRVLTYDEDSKSYSLKMMEKEIVRRITLNSAADALTINGNSTPDAPPAHSSTVTTTIRKPRAKKTRSSTTTALDKSSSSTPPTIDSNTTGTSPAPDEDDLYLWSHAGQLFDEASTRVKSARGITPSTSTEKTSYDSDDAFEEPIVVPAPPSRSRRSAAARASISIQNSSAFYVSSSSEAEDEDTAHSGSKRSKKQKSSSKPKRARKHEEEDSDFDEIQLSALADDDDYLLDELVDSDEESGIFGEEDEYDSDVVAEVSAKAAARKSRASLSGKPTPKAAEYTNEFLTRKGQSVEDSEDPPISSIYDMFKDLVSRYPEIHKITEQLAGRKLRVATMCSGTESPLLALRMIARTAKQKMGLDLEFDHAFSCEIEPFKQAYIERNFKPPVLFRDVVELGEDEAMTAYGSMVTVPGDIDILIAGTSCVDFSTLNNLKKTLEDQGESGRTYRGMCRYVTKHNPTIVVLENVCGAPWTDIVGHFEEMGYDAQSVKLDSKDYYIPHTRNRVYLCAFKKGHSGLANEWAKKVQSLKRPASSSFEAFMLHSDDPRVLAVRTKMAKENMGPTRGRIDWDRCEQRHSKARYKEQLGFKRPFTSWDESGSCQFVDTWWKEFGANQVNRVRDLIDITFLRAAQADVDPAFKAEIWNLSQNVDRTISARITGIAACITPSTIAFITNRGGPMIGLEALSMQGLPIDELYLTRETEDNLFDLAGNAMTTIVVGTCILTALTLGSKLLVKEYANPLSNKRIGDDDDERIPRPIFIGQDRLARSAIDFADFEDRTFAELVELCKKSRRMCICEGRHAISSSPIQVCEKCGFSSCTACGGKPEHLYKIVDTSDRLPPREVEKMIKDSLPMRIVVDGIDADGLDSLIPEGVKVDDALWTAYKTSTTKAISSELRFTDIRRQDIWIVTFSSLAAKAELSLGPDPEWLLYAIPDKNEPANSKIRSMLESPIARMKLNNWKTQEDDQWELHLPVFTSFTVVIDGNEVDGEQRTVPAWQDRLGLQGKYAGMQQYESLRVEAVPVSKYMEDISGVYHALPKCGTAKDQLYKSESGISLFFDPSRCRNPTLDHAVFARDNRRLEYQESRITIAKLSPEWHPYTDNDNVNVEATMSGLWIPVPGSTIAPHRPPKAPVVMQPSDKDSLAVDHENCEHSTTLLYAEIPRDDESVKVAEIDEELWEKAATGDWFVVDNIHARGVFKDLRWITERARKMPMMQTWSVVETAAESKHCDRCAPLVPTFQLVSGQKGIIIQEDIGQASKFEYALKRRPEPFTTEIKIDADNAMMRIGLNCGALLHRGVARFPPSMNPTSALKLSWRIDTEFEALQVLPQCKFVLQSNREDTPCAQPPVWNPRNKLRPEQLRSLAWMNYMETEAAGTFTEEEIVECILEPIGWRAEGKVEREVTVRGGVLADEVGYGKTAISIGLISCTQDAAAADERVTSPERRVVDGQIQIKATLILIPGHLIQQWVAEFQKFTFNEFDIIQLSGLNSLNKYSIEDFMKTDVIVAASSIFDSVNYHLNLACLAGVPSIPVTKNGSREFAFRYERALEILKTQTEILVKDGATAMLDHARKSFEETLKDEVTSIENSKRLKGAKLQQRNSKSGSKKKDLNKERAQRLVQDPFCLKSQATKRDWKKMKAPLFEMFRFNRVIIDEYTYLDGAVLEMIQHISAEKRWILSGTPPLSDFSSVKSIASFLGIHLGIDDDNEGNSDTMKKRKRDQTAVERFHSYREMRSLNWHAHRNQIAQAFLTKYARQNTADIDEILKTEKLKMVSLTMAEGAIYLELKHFLQLLDMRMKKRQKGDSDREQRLNQSLGDSATAEEALLKCASHFDLKVYLGDDYQQQESKKDIGECESIVVIRKRQLDECKRDLYRECVKAEEMVYALMKFHHRSPDKYMTWKQRLGSLGDATVAIKIENIVEEAKRAAAKKMEQYKRGSAASADIELPVDELEFVLDERVHLIHRLAKEYLQRKRALMYFENLLTVMASGDVEVTCLGCDRKIKDRSQITIISSCGHMGCSDCVSAAAMREECFIGEGCASLTNRNNTVMADTIGAKDRLVSSENQIFGSKMEDLADLIESEIPADDRVLLFVQFEALMETAKLLLEDRGIDFMVISGSAHNRSKQLEQFQQVESTCKVLLLNVADESASGANLTVANHIIFLSPLLSNTVDSYRARETQAIGRAVRYGQTKEVKIWRFFTRDTIDTELFENMTGRKVLEEIVEGMESDRDVYC
ncbi:hypothetical protein BZA70DRAFT_270604 [Myxozyma melibiosi]|uniref:Helicase C-terminal domain-containing protein n=1 Tax=Myxozyma melibiosi TaxID=54550 RepID=A0ABR1FBM5_9ASCO